MKDRQLTLMGKILKDNNTNNNNKQANKSSEMFGENQVSKNASLKNIDFQLLVKSFGELL